MKLYKSICLLALLLSACAKPSPSAQSSSEQIFSSSESTSSSQTSESESSDSISSDSGQEEQDPSYNGYYADLTSWNNGEDLKNQLYTILRKNYHPLTYTTPNYETNINADHSYYDFEYLDGVYSEDHIYKSETNKGWQREHAFCASLMCGSLTANAVKNRGRATDFHNLFASSASANSSRGNKNYGVADKTHPTYTNRTVNNGQDGYSFDPVNFEPGDYDKGRLARAIFYMATMYSKDENDDVNHITMKGLQIVEEPVSYVQGENGAFAIGNLSTLISWNNKYYVDYLEMQHNISVYQDVYSADGYAQGNRNPYVDYPELVDYAFGDKKDQAGSLANLIPSEDILHSNEHVFSHYALKEAKRSYELGAKLTDDDYKVVKVYKDYTYEVVNDGYTNSLKDHVFSSDDGESIAAYINAENDRIVYRIILNPLLSCSSGEIFLNTNGIDKGAKALDQDVNYANTDFILNFDSSANITSSNQMTITNITQGGGVTFGSKTKPLTKLIFKTKDSYHIDAAYVKAFIGNVDSSYYLTIKVGDSILLNRTAVNNKDVAKVYGASLNNALEGQLSFIFEGSSSLKINSVAFNEII